MNGDTATITAQPALSLGGQHYIACDLSISRSFTDGSECDTFRFDRGKPFPRAPFMRLAIVFHIANPSQLISVHRHWTDRAASNRVVAPLPGDIVAGLQADYARWYGWLVEIGYLEAKSDENQYVPTSKGIYLMAWRLL